MALVPIEIEVWCSCGAGLCNQSSAATRGQGVVVEPCEKCVDAAKDDSYNDGYAAAESEFNVD
jgi:hypothetical protein